MASLCVKSLVQNLEELPSYGTTSQSLRPKKKTISFVNYSHQLCQARCLRVQAAVVNKNNNNCDPRIPKTGSGSSSSLFDIRDHGSASNGVYSKKKRIVDKAEDVSGLKLHQWVKDSVVEIVNNLDEAPFLVHIYPDGEEASASTGKTRLVSEKAAAENWPVIKGRWGGESPTPSGIILVEEMNSSEEAGLDGENLGSTNSDNKSCSSSTKLWGILIQGKGLSCPACYILKTSRVSRMLKFQGWADITLKSILEPVRDSASSSTFDKDDSQKVAKQSPKKKKRKRSDVWNHFTELEVGTNGVKRCECKYCGKQYNCESANGTGNMKRHLARCVRINTKNIAQALIDAKDGSLRNPKISQEKFREILSFAIIKHDLPFSFVEYEEIRDVFKYLNPNVKNITRHTAKIDILKLHGIETQKVKVMLNEYPGRICLTSDLWTSIAINGYMSLTAHFVDKE
ncbi:hypothetical protein ACH5RR_033764 [Cinchona calisaya]|uniref:BED-type domain-containing protein n=1 Tax=Cinchona calisaya TaxID=153742 RepID=A0ABD2Y8X2_9GENT